MLIGAAPLTWNFRQPIGAGGSATRECVSLVDRKMVLDCRTQMEASTWTGFTEEEKAKIRLNYENSSQGK